jgi:SulP family sulfate permease
MVRSAARHNPNRELFGQGIGNVIAGLIGGLPGAGASVSTVTNIRAGGSTRVSGALRAMLVLALVLGLGLGHLVAPIPHAVLAAILIKVGWDLVDRDLLSRARHLRRDYLIVIVTTLTLTVFVDLITGGAVGLIAAGMVHARQLERFEMQSVISVPLLDRNLFAGHAETADADPGAARVGLVRLKGGFTVASSRQLVDVIGADIKGHDVVIFDFSSTTYLDDSAAKLIGELLDIAREQRTAFIVVGPSDTVAQTLFAFGVLQRVPEACLVESTEQASEVARGLLVEEKSG